MIQKGKVMSDSSVCQVSQPSCLSSSVEVFSLSLSLSLSVFSAIVSRHGSRPVFTPVHNKNLNY